MAESASSVDEDHEEELHYSDPDAMAERLHEVDSSVWAEYECA